MQTLLLIGAGGALGAISRHLVGQLALRLVGPGLPWGTLAVNLVGSLAMGVLIGALAAWGKTDTHWLRHAAGIGFLGGFTTFSAFSLELVVMLERKAWGMALAYMSVSVVLSAGAVMAGLMIMRKVTG
ncbi:fluoride efflux transporter CrcB [Maricaulis sp. D1M11]|uniref:fluoride efflux transporter CrcB n=1 Tax=Maricaulis sp. D1M11 TaxID=3076117 RepID=UPI0039B68BD5